MMYGQTSLLDAGPSVSIVFSLVGSLACFLFLTATFTRAARTLGHSRFCPGQRSRFIIGASGMLKGVYHDSRVDLCGVLFRVCVLPTVHETLGWFVNIGLCVVGISYF